MESETPEYCAWKNMRRRCHSPKHPKFHYWGGRGITVCKKWRNSYSVFLEDVRRRPSPKHTLGRIDNNGNYEPGNVRWELQREQVRNSRKGRKISYGDRTMLLIEWSEETGLRADVIRNRLDRRWPTGEALSFETHIDGRSKRRPWQSRLLSYGGKTMTISEWSQEIGTKTDDIRNRLRYGWSAGQALGLEPPKRLPDEPKLIEYHGERMTLKHWGKRTGIPWRTIKSRLNILGWAVGQALGFEVR